jgi:hypothetical protein
MSRPLCSELGTDDTAVRFPVLDHMDSMSAPSGCPMEV